MQTTIQINLAIFYALPLAPSIWFCPVAKYVSKCTLLWIFHWTVRCSSLGLLVHSFATTCIRRGCECDFNEMLPCNFLFSPTTFELDYRIFQLYLEVTQQRESRRKTWNFYVRLYFYLWLLIRISITRRRGRIQNRTQRYKNMKLKIAWFQPTIGFYFKCYIYTLQRHFGEVVIWNCARPKLVLQWKKWRGNTNRFATDVNLRTIRNRGWDFPASK